MGRGIKRLGGPLLAAAVALPAPVAAGQEVAVVPPQQIGANPVEPKQIAALADVPDTTIVYYDVAGTDRAAIHRAMLKLRPTDPADGTRVDAVTRTALRWGWPVRDGACVLQQATISFSATVTLPRLADATIVPDDIRAEWLAYLARLEAHELVHVRHGYDGRLEVLAAIKAATCDTARAAADTALAAIQQRDIAFDRRTDHGRRDDVAF